jgi:small subunit ribosomal protein S6
VRKYETIFIIVTNLNEADTKAQIEAVKKFITDNQGTIVTVEDWGKKKLAYEIKKEKYGNYVFVTFDSEPKLVAPLDRFLRLNENIIRHLVVIRQEGNSAVINDKDNTNISSWEVAEGKAADTRSFREN